MAGDVWVVLQQREGTLHRTSLEALAAGQRLAAEGGGRAAAVLLGAGLEALAAEVAGFDLAALYTVDDPQLGAYTPGGYVAVLAPAVERHAPQLVVFPHTYQTVDYAPRLAQALGAPFIPQVTGYARHDGGLVWRRPVVGGKLQAEVRARGAGPVLVSVQSGSFPADGAARGSAERRQLEVERSRIVPDREILGVEQVAGEQVDLTKAGVIVAVGRGVGGADKMAPLEELAAALGAEIGASRPVIDNGWLPRDRQIGSSGQTVAPKLYIAAGISGAIQHLVGMKGARCVVAINKDASAPIFSVARYGIVGDLHEVVPALTAAIREVKG